MYYVYSASVDLDSFSSPGVRPTLRLTSSTQVVCVCACAFTSTHPPTTLTPANIEKYTRKLQSLSLPKHSLPRQQQAQTMDKLKKTPFHPPLTHACGCWKAPVIHTHVVERLDSTNKQIARTRVHMYTLWRVWAKVFTAVSTTPVPVYILVCTGVQNTFWCSFFPPHNMYICTHASTPEMTAPQRLHEGLMPMQGLHVSTVRQNPPHSAPPTLVLHCIHVCRLQYPSTPLDDDDDCQQ